jgi:hypothetical protein
MYVGFHVRYPLFLLDFNETYILFDRFSKNTQISNFMKIRPVGAEFIRTDRRIDGRTDIKKLIVAFRNFAKAPKDLRSAHRTYLCVLNIVYTVHVYQYNCTIHQHMHFTIKINSLLKSPTYVSDKPNECVCNM